MDQFTVMLAELKTHTQLLNRIAAVLENAANEAEPSSSEVPEILPLQFDGFEALDKQ